MTAKRLSITNSNTRKTTFAIAQTASFTAFTIGVRLTLTKALSIVDVSLSFAAIIHISISSESELIAYNITSYRSNCEIKKTRPFLSPYCFADDSEDTNTLRFTISSKRTINSAKYVILFIIAIIRIN